MTHLDELVSAAKSLDETPPPEAGARMWSNVAAKVAGGAAVGVAVATAGANSASAATTTAATSSLGLTLAKVGAAVALTAGIGVGVATVAVQPDPAPPETPAVVAQDSDPPAQRRATRAPAPEETASEELAPDESTEETEDVLEIVDEEPVPKPKARPRKRPQPALEPAPTPASVLADESALLGKAKVAVSGGRNKDALAAIRAHASKFPNGELAEVRRALEVKVLCNLGRADEARKAGDRFLKKHRRSALAGQVRSSCAYADSAE
jgi:hypothetical protein